MARMQAGRLLHNDQNYCGAAVSAASAVEERRTKNEDRASGVYLESSTRRESRAQRGSPGWVGVLRFSFFDLGPNLMKAGRLRCNARNFCAVGLSPAFRVSAGD